MHTNQSTPTPTPTPTPTSTQHRDGSPHVSTAFKVSLPCKALRCPSRPKRARSDPGRCCRARCTEGSPMSCFSTVTASRRHRTMAQQGPLLASFTLESLGGHRDHEEKFITSTFQLIAQIQLPQEIADVEMKPLWMSPAITSGDTWKPGCRTH